MDVPKAQWNFAPRRSATTGASLVSILVIVVVLGGLAATAVVGVSSLTGSSNTVGTIAPSGTVPTDTAHPSTTVAGVAGGIGADVGAAALAACNASTSAANSASTLFYVNSSSYPTKWSDLTTGNPPAFAPATNVAVNANNPAELDGRGWKMTMTGGGSTAPTFTCAARPAK
jgi:hypothetical protein